MCEPCTLYDVGDDVLARVLRMVGADGGGKAVARVGCVSARLSKVSADEGMWRDMVARRWGVRAGALRKGGSWRALYAEFHSTQRMPRSPWTGGTRGCLGKVRLPLRDKPDYVRPKAEARRDDVVGRRRDAPGRGGPEVDVWVLLAHADDSKCPEQGEGKRVLSLRVLIQNLAGEAAVVNLDSVELGLKEWMERDAFEARFGSEEGTVSPELQGMHAPKVLVHDGVVVPRDRRRTVPEGDEGGDARAASASSCAPLVGGDSWGLQVGPGGGWALVQLGFAMSCSGAWSFEPEALERCQGLSVHVETHTGGGTGGAGSKKGRGACARVRFSGDSIWEQFERISGGFWLYKEPCRLTAGE